METIAPAAPDQGPGGAAPLTPRRVFWLMLAVFFVWGVEEGWELQRGSTSPGYTVALMFVFSFLSFLWYRLDSDRQGYRRNLPLNGAILGLALLAYPYYILRSRPRGRRLRALLGLCGAVLLMALSSGLGSILWDLLG